VSLRDRVVLIANKSAGSLLGEGVASPREQLEAAGVQVSEPGPGDLPDRVAEAVRAGDEAVVAAGGDGTIALVAGALAGSDRVMGVLPLGTMNMLARDLGLPLDPAMAARVIADGTERRIDLAEATAQGGAPHIYTCAAMIGLPSHLARYRERMRGNMGISGWWRFLVATQRAMRGNARLSVGVQVGKRTRRLRAQSIVVANNPLDGPPPLPMSRTSLDGGRLVLYVVPRLGWFSALGLALQAIVGKVHQSSNVITIEADEFVIRSARPYLRVLLDGEARLMAPPIRFRILPRSLRVLVPASE